MNQNDANNFNKMVRAQYLAAQKQYQSSLDAIESGYEQLMRTHAEFHAQQVQHHEAIMDKLGEMKKEQIALLNEQYGIDDDQ